MSHDRSYAGIRQSGTGTIPGKHAVLTSTMIYFRVSHAANNRQLICNLGRCTHVRTEVNPWNRGCDRIKNATVLGWRIWLGVEAIHMRKATLQVNMDDRLRLGFTTFRFGCNSSGFGLRFQPQHIPERQPSSAQPTHVHKVAAIRTGKVRRIHEPTCVAS